MDTLQMTLENQGNGIMASMPKSWQKNKRFAHLAAQR
jgi:hypothetical protein